MGRQPTGKVATVSTKADQLRPGAEQLTVEAAESHSELLEVRQSVPLGRNSTSELVRSAVKARVATRQIKKLKRSRKHLWQRPCAKSNITSAAKMKSLSTISYISCMDAEPTSQIVKAEVDFRHGVPSSPMLAGSCSPALSLNSTVFPSTNFQRKRTTGISPVHPIM